MKRTQQGFTLIELMIVVAIIGILAAIAIPAYENYTIRAQVTEGMSLADGVQTAIAEYYTENGAFPSDNTTAGVSEGSSITGNYVSSVEADHSGTAGVVTITYSNVSPRKANQALNGAVLTISAVTASGSVKWVCGNTSDGTTVSNKYLPSSCRG